MTTLTTQPRPRNALVAIDLLRFAAAMMVLAHHYFGKWRVRAEYGLGPTPPSETIATNPWLHSGWVGVEIFFVISGYVIATSARNASPADFAAKRFLRLWPAAFICATLTALVMWINGIAASSLWPRWAASAFLYPSASQIDGVYWTLGVECAFYLLVAVLLWAGRWRPIPVAVALSLWSLAYWIYAVGITGLSNIEFDDRLADLSLGRYGAFFSLGILIEAAHRRDSMLKSWMFVAPLLVAPLCIAWHSASQRAGAPTHSVEIEPQLLFLVGLALVVAAPSVQKLVKSPGITRVAVALGIATYPLYLLHHYLGETGLLWLVAVGWTPLAAVAAITPAVIALSLFIAMKVEPVMRRGLRRLWSLRRHNGESLAAA